MVVVVDAVEKELPALKIACASAERTEKECKRERAREGETVAEQQCCCVCQQD